MLYKADILTREADRLKYGICAPLLHNRDTIEICFQVSALRNSGLILRNDVMLFPMDEIAFMGGYMAEKYPTARVSLMADNVTTYEQAVKAIMCGCTGMALSDTIPLTEENLPFIKSVTRLARALNVSVQATIPNLKDLENGKGYQLVQSSHVDMLKLMLHELHENNVDEYAHLIHVQRKETLCTLALDYEEIPSKDVMLRLREAGISKFDMYGTFSESIMDILKAMCMDVNENHKKLFMLSLSNQMDKKYQQVFSEIVHTVGHFLP